ncbi:MAG: RNA polymerase sigma factor, partial [Pseudomonadota bacterium]
WVFGIARNCWLSEVRRRKVRMGAGQIPPDEADEVKTIVTGECDVIARDLHSAIGRLPPDLASILLVVTIEGYSYAEAAALFHIPQGTVMSRVHRGRKMLATRLGRGNVAGQGIQITSG